MKPDEGPDRRRDAARAVLGAMLVDPEAAATAIRILKDEDFQVIQHRTIFHAIRALRAAAQVINVVTVCEFLRKMGELKIVGGPNSVSDLIGYASDHSPIEYYAKTIRDES